MKTATLLMITVLMAGCASHHADSANADSAKNKLEDTAKRQQASADSLTDDYMDCIDDINHKTAVENYTDKNTRREVVLESCREEATRFTILQEQAYDNACRASGKDATSCDNQAVSKAKRDTDALLQKAHKRIDQTSAARHAYER
jgi:PBP1b-binding outer membrane lipoprotein LpoB